MPEVNDTTDTKLTGRVGIPKPIDEGAYVSTYVYAQTRLFKVARVNGDGTVSEVSFTHAEAQDVIDALGDMLKRHPWQQYENENENETVKKEKETDNGNRRT